MTFGQADDLVYEFATNRIATPGRPTQRWAEVCLSRLLMRSLRVGFVARLPVCDRPHPGCNGLATAKTGDHNPCPIIIAGEFSQINEVGFGLPVE